MQTKIRQLFMPLIPITQGEDTGVHEMEYEPQIWCECGNDKWIIGKIQLNVETKECPPMVRSCYRCSLCESVRLEYRKSK